MKATLTMMQSRGTKRLLANLLLAVLLVTAQAGAAVHALQHDTGALQAKPCSMCVTAAQLGAASVGDAVTPGIAPHANCYEAVYARPHASRNVLVTRQRGPPAPL